MARPSLRRSKRVLKASEQASSTSEPTTADPTSSASEPTIPNQQSTAPKKKKGPRKKALVLPPRKQRPPRSKRNPPAFVGTKGRNTSSGNGVHPGIPKARSAKSKQAVVPIVASSASGKEHSRAFLLATVLLQADQGPELLNLHRDEGTTDQVYLECVARNGSGNDFGFKIRTADRVHYEFDLNGQRAYRLYFYKHDMAIFLDILYRNQLKSHLELYLDTTTHQKVRSTKNLLAHLQGFVQQTSGYEKDKKSKLKHSNMISQAQRMVPSPTSTQNRYAFRPSTARQKRVDTAATTAEENPGWKVYLPNIDHEWAFTGWLGRHAKEIEALEGGWITGDGEIIGLECDWEHNEDEWRVQGRTETEQADVNADQITVEVTQEEGDEAVANQATSTKPKKPSRASSTKKGETSKGMGRGKKKN